MQYLALIYDVETERQTWSEEQIQQNMDEYFSFTAETRANGQFIAGDALMPVATATSVRVREGEIVTTDGPFAETKEQLGGYYLLECKDLDEAIQLASKIPAARHGTIEVRPIMVLEGH